MCLFIFLNFLKYISLKYAILVHCYCIKVIIIIMNQKHVLRKMKTIKWTKSSSTWITLFLQMSIMKWSFFLPCMIMCVVFIIFFSCLSTDLHVLGVKEPEIHVLKKVRPSISLCIEKC